MGTGLSSRFCPVLLRAGHSAQTHPETSPRTLPAMCSLGSLLWLSTWTCELLSPTQTSIDQLCAVVLCLSSLERASPLALLTAADFPSPSHLCFSLHHTVFCSLPTHCTPFSPKFTHPWNDQLSPGPQSLQFSSLRTKLRLRKKKTW